MQSNTMLDMMHDGRYGGLYDDNDRSHYSDVCIHDNLLGVSVKQQHSNSFTEYVMFLVMT